MGKKRKLSNKQNQRNSKIPKPHPASPSSTKKQRKQQQHPPLQPFTSSDTVLLVGEGDLSFTLALSRLVSPHSLIATTYDSHTELVSKYPNASRHLSLIAPTTQVLHSISASSLHKTKSLKTKEFTKIAFLFPHVGGKTKDVLRQARYNQELLRDFFESAEKVLAKKGGGRIVVSTFVGEHYDRWDVRGVAKGCGLNVERSGKFDWGYWKGGGYGHVRTLGELDGIAAWKGQEREARLWVFKREGEDAGVLKKKRKRGAESSDDEMDGETTKALAASRDWRAEQEEWRRFQEALDDEADKDET